MLPVPKETTNGSSTLGWFSIIQCDLFRKHKLPGPKAAIANILFDLGAADSEIRAETGVSIFNTPDVPHVFSRIASHTERDELQIIHTTLHSSSCITIQTLLIYPQFPLHYGKYKMAVSFSVSMHEPIHFIAQHKHDVK